MLFKDRADAGRRLAELLRDHRGERPIVLGLPRGGVPVAYEVAKALGAPLDVAIVRKLGVPGWPELAMGAVAEDGVRILNDDVVAQERVTPRDIEQATAEKRREVEERARRFRGGRPPPNLRGRTVILVDNGIATGATALAAAEWARRQGPARLILAAGVIPADSVARLRKAVDELVFVRAPARFGAVGAWYDDFRPTTDEDVVEILAKARAMERPA